VGCGDGGSPELVTKIEATVKATDTKAIAVARNIAAALDEVALPLSVAAAAALNVPGATTLTFTGPAPTGTVGGIATATIAAGEKSLDTTVSAGSCKFKVTGPADPTKRITKPNTNPAAPYAIGDEIVVESCTISTDELTGLNTTPRSRTVTVTIGTATVTARVQAVKEADGTVKFNGQEVATQSETGALSF
jgi:hypothetical protein